MSDWIPLGPHRYFIDNDLVTLETFGDFAPSEMVLLNSLHNEVGARCGYVLFFINNRVPGTLSAESRRVAAENNRTPGRAPWSMALIGFEGARGVLARAAVVLAAQAIRLLTGTRFPLQFFPTEAAA